jgi:hypothetical protein
MLLSAGAVASVFAAVLIWAPEGIRGWLGAVLAAVVAGLVVDYVLKVKRAVQLRSAPATESRPLAATVTLKEADYFSVAGERGASIQVPCSGYTLQVTIEAVKDGAVVLTAMRPVILCRRKPSGILSPRAGILQTRPFTVLLDGDPPRMEARGGNAADFPFRVTYDDPEVFELQVETAHWDVTWVLELDWIYAGSTGTTRIDFTGHPFRTIARPPGRALEW